MQTVVLGVLLEKDSRNGAELKENCGSFKYIHFYHGRYFNLFAWIQKYPVEREKHW